MAVYTSNFGISVVYQCEYRTALTVSSDSFDVQAKEWKFKIISLKNTLYSCIIYLPKFSIFNNFKTVSAFGQNNGFGNLANGFSLNLSTPGERFIMGGQLEVAIEWNARFLGQFSFRIKDCSVQHGDVSVSVIKEWALRFSHHQWGDR